MLPLDHDLGEAEIAELLRSIRQSTSSAVNALLQVPQPGGRPDVDSLLRRAGLAPIAHELYCADLSAPAEHGAERDGTHAGTGQRVYASYSEVDHDAVILRPLAWR